MTSPATPDRDRDAGLPGRPGDRPGDRDRPGAHPDQGLPETEKPKPGTPTQLPAEPPPDAKPK